VTAGSECLSGVEPDVDGVRIGHFMPSRDNPQSIRNFLRLKLGLRAAYPIGFLDRFDKDVGRRR
jgi:hypothetical protein